MDFANMDFITFVCRVLNHSDPSQGFDTFEVGSVKVDPPRWPKPKASSSSSSMLLPTISTRSDAVIREILERPWIDHLKKKEYRQVALIKKNFNPNKKNTEPPKETSTTTLLDKKVKNKGADTFLDTKLEASKKKLREQYDKIENEKKRRRIQITEFQKPVQVQTKPKKKPAAVKKPSKRNGMLVPAATLLHRAPHVSVFS